MGTPGLRTPGGKPPGAAPDAPRVARPERRRFLDAVLGLSFVSTAVAVFYPIWRFLIPPRGGEPETASVAVGRLADIAPNSGQVFRFGNRPAILVRTPDGDLRAFTAICTHLDCTVQYKSDTSQIWCACHNGYYDLSGNVVSGPPPRPLEQYAVNVRGDAGEEEVVVSRG